jgi:hypothetical protein
MKVISQLIYNMKVDVLVLSAIAELMKVISQLTYNLIVDVLVLSANLDLVVPPGDRGIGDGRC